MNVAINIDEPISSLEGVIRDTNVKFITAIIILPTVSWRYVLAKAEAIKWGVQIASWASLT